MQRKTEQVSLTPFLTPTLSPLDFQPQLPDLPGLDLEPASDVPIADHNLNQVAQQFDELGTLQTSDISNGSPGKVRSMLQQSSTAPNHDVWEQGSNANGLYDIGKTPVFDAESLKVEVPMMPSYQGSDLEPEKGGRTAFKDMMDEFIDLSPMQIDLRGDGDVESDQHDAFLLDRIVDQSHEFGKAVMPEAIGVNDAALRVEVPQLSNANFSHPATTTSKHDMLESALSHQQVQQVSVNPVEEMSMTWIPVPKHLMRLDMKESIEHTDVLRHLIAAPENVIRSEQLLWNEPGLRILDDDDGDSEIEEMEEDPSLQLIPRSTLKTSVPAKRSADDGPMASNKRTGSIAPDDRSGYEISPDALVDEIESTQDILGCQQAIQLQPFKIGTVSEQRQHGPQTIPFPTTTMRPMRTPGPYKPKPFKMPYFSASGSVSSFLVLQGKQFKAPSVGIGRESIRDLSDPIEVSQVPLDECQASDPDHYTSTTSEPVLVPSTPSQVVLKQQSPVDIERLQQARTVVIDSALVSNRPLMALFDNDRQQQLTTIYRDLKGCPDLILSPLTCLIYTNLQALTQTSLPGQSTKNMLKDKIAQSAATYESLYVMVSTSAQVLSSQHDVVADFTFFCSSFQMMEKPVKVIPLWVAVAEAGATRWSEDTIALNTWKLVLREAFRNSKEQLIDQIEHPAPILIQDETVWEVFLCRAGTNPMAAQVILGMLKDTGVQKEAWGLRRLVRMSSEERLQQFAGLVGRKCIEHLNHVLESTCS